MCVCVCVWGWGLEESIPRLFILDNLWIPTCIACSSISEAQYTSISIPSSFKAWNPEIVKQKKTVGYIRMLPFGCSRVVNPSVFQDVMGVTVTTCNSISVVYFYFPERTCTYALLQYDKYPNIMVLPSCSCVDYGIWPRIQVNQCSQLWDRADLNTSFLILNKVHPHMKSKFI